ncbi:MAG: LysR family transcriptional regulator, partial [Desulfovibrio sp.]|nr:LysR family transcriptional regulator [Desulfovibrio sp.]
MKNLPALDALRAFALAAEQLNLRRTAEILHISQPPLSRKIQGLERSVGMKLFNRGRRGMELTAAGKELLAIVQPLLSMAENVREKMDALADSDALRVGLTTAFEQCVFASSLGAVRAWSAAPPVLKRAPSIRLVKAVADGELDFAMVALPVPGKDMAVIETGYAEPLLAAMPSSWKITEEFINLTDLNGRPFFWFPAARNPAWHERMGRVFATLGFSPQFIEEPPEYDVALSCV